jgi:hypothetical protein
MEHYLYDKNYNKAKLTRVDDLQGDTLKDKLEMGVVHTKKAAEFASQVQKAFRGCKLRSNFLGDGVRVLDVYMEGDTYTMGSIWITFNGDADTLYVVSSHRIQNNRHDSGSNEHRQCHSINLKTAVKNAQKYLQRLSHAEMVEATAHHCYGAINDYLGSQTYKVDTLIREVFHYGFDMRGGVPHHVKEMFHLAEMEHKFLDLEWSRKLSKTRIEYNNHVQTLADCSSDVYCVQVYEKLGTTMFDVTKTVDSHLNMAYSRYKKEASLGSLTMEELPEGVIDKVSALAICMYGEFIPCVGYRFDESIFYVTQ